jgi:phosphoglycolate phosphatase-like HAD superfamily hydrolase
MMMTTCYIFDIDGTLADNKHRTHHLEKSPKDWDAYHKGVDLDGSFNRVTAVALALQAYGFDLVYCTGRREGQRQITQEWLLGQGLRGDEANLYMRKEGDHRPDHIIKLELLAKIRADGFDPVMAFDDRNSVVKMWRDAGVPCAQVAEGDF